MKSAYNIRPLVSSCLVGSILVLALIPGFGQDTLRSIPDGTAGERLEEVHKDTARTSWREKRWRLFPGKFSTLKLGGGFLYEFASYSQDAASKRQTDSMGSSLQPNFSVRDFRITASGQLKTKKRPISWKLGFMYDGVTDTWLVRESGITIGVPELWGRFFIGRTKEGFSMNKVMVGYAGWMLERQMAIDVIPILADGVKWLGYLPKSRIFWNVGVYADYLSSGQSFSTYKWQYASRVGWLPIYSGPDKRLLHLGVNYRYGQPEDSKIQVRSRPEVNAAPRFIDTGVFPSNYSNSIGGEAYYRSGKWMVGTEFYAHNFHSPQAGNPEFFGGEVVASYMFTGESRPYYTDIGIFGFVNVKKPVSKGGPGAWEALIRYSSLDLNGGSVQGGKFWRITPCVNWYLSNSVRLELEYGYGVLDRFSLKGATQFFQCRVQFVLM